ncbi:MAG TPA: ABC transporter ATP-binding protein [Terriglobales bacterium]|nr:ABC transporter ATP-binding protein [Terriglobales bacterium]
MRPAIVVEQLGKQYQIGTRENYDTFRDAVVRKFRHPLARKQQPPTFWALRDVSFRATAGEVIGIVGRNGAGKSTLLKVLSRITEPTTGRIDLFGRVGSLLEVGTGFHQELTGRENVFLNGAILGMKRAEIAAKFDDIVAFAEVERFIDTPVKRYSSGMYLRLAFSVAAFLESEILLVDEVLAVGDASFQKRCLGKMRDISTGGRTVIFVSHNMAAIESLCTRCLMFSQGQLSADGNPHEVIGQYMAANLSTQAPSRDLRDHENRHSGMKQLMRRITLLSAKEDPVSSVRMGESLSVQIDFEAPDHPIRPTLEISVKNSFGVVVFSASNRVMSQYHFERSMKRGAITCKIPDLPLVSGLYSMDVYFGEEYQALDAIYDAISFEVTPADVFGSGHIPTGNEGTIFWPTTWSVSSDFPGEQTSQ